MRIAVVTAASGRKGLDINRYLVEEVFHRLVEAKREHEFIFFVERQLPQGFANLPNVTTVFNEQQSPRSILFRWLYKVRFTLSLKKHNVDIIINLTGACQRFGRIRQVMLMHDLSAIHFPRLLPKIQVYRFKKITPECIRQVQALVTFSGHARQKIAEYYSISTIKVINIEYAVRNGYEPLDWSEKERIKEEYVNGCEYFLFKGDFEILDNLVNLLKAFTLFKTRQRSNMKLVIIGNVNSTGSDTTKLSTYKFRHDLKVYSVLSDEETKKLVAAAYAIVIPSFFETFGLAAAEAMESAVPLIISKNTHLEEIAGEAALYMTPEDPADIAEQLKLIYKDENLRSKLIVKGREQAAKYSWHKTVGLMWQAIQQANSK